MKVAYLSNWGATILVLQEISAVNIGERYIEKT